MPYTFGDVLLVPLTFSDVSNSKRRPVLVLLDVDSADLLVVPVTSHKPRNDSDVILQEWTAAGLRLPSTVRMAKLATVARVTVIRQLGRLSERDAAEARKALSQFFQRITEAAN